METYQSPFSSRYGSGAMRRIWSDNHRRRLWRRFWVALAEAQAEAGLVSAAQVEDLRAHAELLNTKRSLAIEAEIGHDLMAEVKSFAEQCAVGGGIIHWGATSADVTDNADALRIREALDLLLAGLRALLLAFAGQIERHAGLVCMALTHLQPAEPTTMGYRLAGYAQDLLGHLARLNAVRGEVKGKGVKGAVGTGASFEEMLQGTGWSAGRLESAVMARLELPCFPISTQTYPRIQDYAALSALAGLAASLHKFAFDLRLLQARGEVAEPFGEQQVGSSAMPFKRNPVNAEKICSLARLVAALPAVAWGNAANAALERSLDDSANRRSLFPEAFLALDEMLATATAIVRGLQVDAAACARGLAEHGPYAATERLLTALVRAGGDRQAMHARLREHSLRARRAGDPGALAGALCSDPELLRRLRPARVRELMRAEGYTGQARERALALAADVRKQVTA